MAARSLGGAGVKIAIMVEGRTEMAFKPTLRNFLETRLPGNMPKVDFVPYDGRIPKGDKLRRIVGYLLTSGMNAAQAVIALTDVYTGTRDFDDAADAKTKMRGWVGDEPRFFPHAAQHDFEAWLLPYWPKIQELAKHNRTAPSGMPEKINHQNPPSTRIAEIFRIGSCPHHYSKAREAARILRGEDIAVATAACQELKAFLNTMLTLGGAAAMP